MGYYGGTVGFCIVCVYGIYILIFIFVRFVRNEFFISFSVCCLLFGRWRELFGLDSESLGFRGVDLVFYRGLCV